MFSSITLVKTNRYLLAGTITSALLLVVLLGSSFLDQAKIFHVLRWLHSGLDYHPDNSHSIMLGGFPSVVCARNTGIYVGTLTVYFWSLLSSRTRLFGFPSLRISIILASFVVLMAVDGFNSLAHDLGISTPYKTTTLTRLGTGLLMGTAAGCFLVPVLNGILWKESSNKPFVDNTRSLAGLLCMQVPLFLIVALKLDFFALPLALLTTMATIVLFTTINLIFIVAIFNRLNKARNLLDILPEISISVLLSLGELSITAILVPRFLLGLG